MLRIPLLVVLVATIAGSLSAEVVKLKEGGSPIWVSATSALGAHGAIRTELFEASTAARLNRIIQKQQSTQAEKSASALLECPFTVTSHRGRTASSVEDAVEHADGVFIGRITSLEQGFRDGVPESLLTVEVERAEGGKLRTPPKGVRVFYPRARFVVGQAVFCNRGPRDDYEPEVGDSVVLLPAGPPLELQASDPREPALYYVSEEEMIFGRGETVVLPARLANDPWPKSSWAEFVNAIVAKRVGR